MEKTKNNQNIKVNDKVWIVTRTGDVDKCRVTAFLYDKETKKAIVETQKSSCFELTPIDKTYTPINKVFVSKGDALKETKRSCEERKQKLSEELQTKDDFIRYLFDNAGVSLCEEYTDYQLRQIVKELAKEKFELDL